MRPHYTTTARYGASECKLDAASLAANEALRPEDASSIPDLLSLAQAHARLILAVGNREAAAERLVWHHGQASSLGWHFWLPRVRALQALATATTDQALEILAQALALAEPENHVRAFLDLGAAHAAVAGTGVGPQCSARLRPPSAALFCD